MNVRIVVAALLAPLALAAAGCGGGGSGGPSITIQPGRAYQLRDFKPSGPVAAGRPTTLSFEIVKPDGQVLTAYKHGSGPHNGIHLILVRRDLGVIIHRHPPVGPDGTLSDRITFPAPGPYRVVIDAYPKNSGPVPNFQLFTNVTVAGRYRPQALPPLRRIQTDDGYHFSLRGTPRLHAVQAAVLDFNVVGPDGKPVVFKPWFGALAHAIFFRKGSLDYFHTHVCAPGASGCSSALGGARVTGTSATPGRLKVGVLVPVAGTWRLFIQFQDRGKVVTAPFTLHVA
jgi:hypothetical protein